MKKIKSAERRENLLILLASLMLSLIGAMLIWHFLQENIFLVIIGFSITILGMFFLIKRFNILANDEYPITTMLLKEPRKVVWVYSIVTQRMPFGFVINHSGTMYFKLIDGSEMTLSLPAEELKSTSEMLNYHLPHATFGYTKEREQWFLAHPEMLVKLDKSNKQDGL